MWGGFLVHGLSFRVPGRSRWERCDPRRLRTFGPHFGGGALAANDGRPRGRRVRPPSSSSRARFSTGRWFPRLCEQQHDGRSAAGGVLNSTRDDVASTASGSRTQRENNYRRMAAALVLRSSADELLRAGIPEPTASACHLLASVLRLPWESGHRDLAALLLERSRRLPPSGDPLSSRTLSAEEAHQYADLMVRRLQHEPIQYLVGQWDFLDSTFRIRAPLLCPRAETEELVLHAERDVRRALSERATDEPITEIRVLDVGCGTGCVGISLLDRLLRKPPAPALRGGVRVQAIDVERAAVEVSRDNARRILQEHGVRVLTDDEEPVDPGPLSCSYAARLCDLRRFDPSERFHVVVSNPPYVPVADRDALEPNVRNFESPVALFGGPDGMDVIRDLIHELPTWCHSNAVCWMEIDPSHPALLRDWIDEQEPSVRAAVTLDEIRCDMFGRQRFVRLLVNPTTDCDKADFLASHQ